MITKIWGYFLLFCLALFIAGCIFAVGVSIALAVKIVYSSSYSGQACDALAIVLGIMFLIGMIRALDLTRLKPWLGK